MNQSRHKTNIMFKQKCFIWKNTPELVKRLEELGYKASFSARNGYGEYLYAFNGIIVGGEYNSYDEKAGFIDCGTNEELFLAIAALRDDTDKNQWFIHKNVEFVFCDQSELKHVTDNTDEYMDYCVADFHKATVQELIEHFNK